MYRDEGEGGSYFNDYFGKATKAAASLHESEEDDCLRLALQVSRPAGLAGRGAKGLRRSERAGHGSVGHRSASCWPTCPLPLLHPPPCTCSRGPRRAAGAPLP